MALEKPSRELVEIFGKVKNGTAIAFVVADQPEADTIYDEIAGEIYLYAV